MPLSSSHLHAIRERGREWLRSVARRWWGTAKWRPVALRLHHHLRSRSEPWWRPEHRRLISWSLDKSCLLGWHESSLLRRPKHRLIRRRSSHHLRMYGCKRKRWRRPSSHMRRKRHSQHRASSLHHLPTAFSLLKKLFR